MLAVAGGKGGTGKTTTTLGLAAALPGRTVAVDTDRGMPNLHALASVPRGPGLVEGATQCYAPDDCRGVESSDATSSASGDTSTALGQPVPWADDVAIVTATRSTSGPGSSEGALLAALTRLRGAAESVLLDCPAGAGPDAVLPLRVADRVLLVSTLCTPALRDTAKTAAMARALDTPVVGAVLTRTRRTPEAVERLLECPVLVGVPAVTPPVRDAPAARAAFVRLARVVRNEGIL